MDGDQQQRQTGDPAGGDAHVYVSFQYR
jgi:hypothetical protein